MNIYFIRHADALPINMHDIASDEERPLSDEGKAQVAALAGAIKRLDAPIDAILTSPLKRGQQAAVGLAEHLGLKHLEVRECGALAPGGSSKKVAKLLRKTDAQHVLVVGHEPDLGRHTAFLIGGKRARIEFAKGGMALILSDDPVRRGTGTLVWMLTPAWLNS